MTDTNPLAQLIELLTALAEAVALVARLCVAAAETVLARDDVRAFLALCVELNECSALRETMTHKLP